MLILLRNKENVKKSNCKSHSIRIELKYRMKTEFIMKVLLEKVKSCKLQ